MVRPSWRKPTGAFIILLVIAGWAALVASLAAPIGRLPGWAQAGLYLLLGLVWILPMKPLLRWMDGGGRR